MQLFLRLDRHQEQFLQSQTLLYNQQSSTDSEQVELPGKSFPK